MNDFRIIECERYKNDKHNKTLTIDFVVLV